MFPVSGENISKHLTIWQIKTEVEAALDYSSPVVPRGITLSNQRQGMSLGTSVCQSHILLAYASPREHLFQLVRRRVVKSL